MHVPVGVKTIQVSSFVRCKCVCVWPLCDQSAWVQVDHSRTGIISFMMVAEDVNADDGAD